ncbi:MAG: hypothetical protein JWM56_1177 [Candidatus Peribacteria bacterium]|nr:hypothetical protein [Candidatus Peribacteria bacterium]
MKMKSSQSEAQAPESAAIPQIPEKQILILSNLSRTRSTSGMELRKLIAELGLPLKGPSYYQFMARLEHAGLVEATHELIQTDVQPLTIKNYTLTAAGEEQIKIAADFYRVLLVRILKNTQ